MKRHNIESKIKKAMVVCSAVCLGILGAVSLFCISYSVEKTVSESMQGTVSVAAGLVYYLIKKVNHHEKTA